MKKLKKLLAVLLAVAAVCALMVASASAAVPYVNYNASDSGVNANCPWNSSLVMSSKEATATIIVQTRSSGIQPAMLSAKMAGYAYTTNGYGLTLAKEASIEASNFLTVTRTRNPYDGDEIIGANCVFTAMGSPAGVELKVGDIW